MHPRTLLDALHDVVVMVGAGGRVLDAGAAARSFLGERLARAGHVADLVDVIEPSARRHVHSVLLTLRRNGHWRGEVGLLDSAGGVVPFEVTVRADPAGGYVLVARDASGESARLTAEHESRSKDEFIARLGHELRTPLNAMLGFAQLLELEPLPAELHDDVVRIIAGGRHMQTLIDDVLDLARLRAGRGGISKGPVNVLDIVRSVVGLVEPLAERRGIRRVIDPAEPLVADADRRRLLQVLLNLVGNAVKYGREGGCIRVGIVGVTGARVRIEVEDDGAGLPHHAVSRLFRPFERLGAERTSVEGSGLGLALSHALVTAMGGVLTAASRVGVGSVFAVVLDAVDTRLAADIPEGVAPDSADGGHDRLRVVHVSGDPAARTTVDQALHSHLDADTVSVPRAALALDAVRRVRPAIVLLDRTLPDATATDLLRQLAADPFAGTIPVVVLSTVDEPRERLRLRQAGAAEVLTSPWDLRSIVAAASQPV